MLIEPNNIFINNQWRHAMAEWRDVAKAFALADQHISEKEVKILRKALFDDGVISKSELNFLKEIKEEAKSSVQLLDNLIEECEKARNK